MTKEFVPYNGYDRLDLTVILSHADRPRGDSETEHWGWSAGEQLYAMKYYAGDYITPLIVSREANWQGEICSVWYLPRYPRRIETPVPKYLLIRDSFGSCGGCDALEGNGNGYEYVKDVLMENTVQFLTMEDLKAYMSSATGKKFFGYRTDDDYNEFLQLIDLYIKGKELLAKNNSYSAVYFNEEVRI